MAMVSDRMSLAASGCAFYATLALIPAVTMLISVYGLAFDPHTVGPQLRYLERIMPPAVYHLIAERVQQLVAQGAASLGLGLAISLGVTLWSAEASTKSLLMALNVAYRRREARGMIAFQLVAFMMTLGAILAAVLGIAVIVFLPAAIAFVGLSAYQTQLLNLSAFAGLVVFVLGSLVLLYRYGPAPGARRRVVPGALAATVLWLVATSVFSFYVGRFAAYNVTYGPLGAFAGLMMWFYVTAYVVLFGAELNAMIDHPRQPRRR